MRGLPLQWLFFTLTSIHASSDESKRPHFVLEPPSRLFWPATKGARAECRAVGNPQPDVHWVTNDGQLLNTIPGLRHILTDGTLVLGARRSLLDASSSTLRCRASNSAGVVLSRPMVLQPVEDNIVTHSVKQLTPAKVSGSVILRCEVPTQLGMVDVTWFQDGLPIFSGYINADSRWVSGGGGLLLGADLTQTDVQAEYTCVVLETPSLPTRLTLDDTTWLENIEINSIEARAGDVVILPCIYRHLIGQNIVWQQQDSSGVWSSISNEAVIKGGALVFPSIRTKNTARYACSVGTDVAPKALVRLTVYELLSVTVTPDLLMVGTAGTGYFNCSVQGGRGGGITINWQHEGRQLHAPHSRLNLGPIRAHHAGIYQCTAQDQFDTVVGSAELLIADRPPVLISTFSEATTRIGQTIALRCAATGTPSPRIHWTLDDRPLPAAPEKYSVSTRAEAIPGAEEGAIVSTLSVSIRTADEGGRYGCNATNTKGSHSHFARLNVIGPPNIRYLPVIHVKADTDVTIHCPYSGYPIKEVLWRNDDGTIVEDIVQSEDRGILRLSSARRSIAGSYTCEVKADSGEIARRTVRIELHKPPKIATFVFPEGLEVGGSTQATCSLVSGDKPIQFTWLKDNLPIPPTLKVEQKNMDFFSLLIIQDLTSLHSGEYTCRATNDFGTVSHSALLAVKEPPSWIWRAQNTSVSAGAAILLPCSAKGQPSPKITWEYSPDSENWRHILWSHSSSESSVGSILSDGTIWLRSVSTDHEGWYKCTARSQHMVLHHTFYVDIREPPKIRRHGGSGEIKWVVRGSLARLACSVRGEPEIHLHWTHDGRPIIFHGTGGVETRESGTDPQLTELTVSHASPEHAGLYKCHARNLYGSDEASFRLFVKERPSTPEEVRISEVWSRKAKVTWRVPKGTFTSHYNIQYRALTRDLKSLSVENLLPTLDSWNTGFIMNLTLSHLELMSFVAEGPNRGGALLSGLVPDTRYALRLSAYNDVGSSAYTSPLHFTTREEAPGGAPRDITVRALKSRELHITWQPPLSEVLHGTLLGYTIKWWEVTDDHRITEEVGSETGAGADSTSTTLRGLKPATRYGVTIRAYNAAGSGPASPPHYRHTLESPPVGSPESVTCLSGGSTSLRVSWRPPPLESRGGVITHYTLLYTKQDADPLVPIQDASLRLQGEETTISRLTPYAEYEVRVRAHNAAGDGPLSAPQMCRTDQDVPSSPGGMKLIALGEKSLRASWLPPAEPNGKLTHYILYIKDLSGPQEANKTRVNVCFEGEALIECMKTIRGVKSGRTYEGWVRAATSVGEGPPSPAVAVQTTSQEPARISSFGGTTVSAAGSSLSLRCVVGGTPPPLKRWLRNVNTLHPRPPFHLDGDALMIRNLELNHADNYTCLAENPHGSDSITWRVIVLRPPVPPTLILLEARSRELEVELRPAPRTPGHANPKSYTLHWRLATPDGDWKSQPASLGPNMISNVRCGSAYRVYASAGGAPGAEVTMRTSGGPPVAPSDSRWIHVNSTHARLETAAWGEGGCGAGTLRAEWAGAGSSGGTDVVTGQDVVLTGLIPGTRYRIAVRATNEAGSTREVYEFTTSLLEGSFAEEVDAPFPATAGELALLLALCAMLSLAALTILAILLRKKRSDGPVRVATHAEKSGCGTYRAPPQQTPKLPPEPPDVYEISPYATFAGAASSGSRAYTLQLRGMSLTDTDAAPPLNCCDEETCIDSCDAQRRRRRRRHYCTDRGCSQDSGS